MSENWIEKKVDDITVAVQSNDEKKYIDTDLQKNIAYFKSQFGDAFDVKYRKYNAQGKEIYFVMVDGMCDSLLATEQVILPIIEADFADVKGDKLIHSAADKVSASIDKSITNDIDESIREAIYGSIIMLTEGSHFAVMFGVQGFPKRAVLEPNTEMQERGSREAFVESFKDNVTMIRRRVRNPVFKTQVVEVGTTSKTRACVCYMSDRVDKQMLENVIDRLKNATVDTVLGSGYMQTFLDTKHPSIFSGVGFTERPDVLTAKISEGKICMGFRQIEKLGSTATPIGTGQATTTNGKQGLYHLVTIASFVNPRVEPNLDAVVTVTCTKNKAHCSHCPKSKNRNYLGPGQPCHYEHTKSKGNNDCSSTHIRLLLN